MRNKKYIPHAEIPVVEHCNLNCSLCNSHAYLVENSSYPLMQFKKDMDVLSKNIHFGFLTFLGGEPLLCKNLHEYVAYAKSKQIGEIYRVLTNGILIKKMPQELMEEIDVIEVSWYPQMKESADDVKKYLKPLAKRYNFTYYVKEIGYFNKIDTVDYSEELAQLGYEKCKRINNTCTIFNGYLYRCMRPKTTNLFLEKKCGIIADIDMRIADGCKISDREFGKCLEEYLNREKRLESCKYCLMGIENNVMAVDIIKDIVFKHPTLIRGIYKRSLLYNFYKHYKCLFQYDEGAHTSNNDLIITCEHKVES